MARLTCTHISLPVFRALSIAVPSTSVTHRVPAVGTHRAMAAWRDGLTCCEVLHFTWSLVKHSQYTQYIIYQSVWQHTFSMMFMCSKDICMEDKSVLPINKCHMQSIVAFVDGEGRKPSRDLSSMRTYFTMQCIQTSIHVYRYIVIRIKVLLGGGCCKKILTNSVG
jgi:hypothetical protein